MQQFSMPIWLEHGASLMSQPNHMAYFPKPVLVVLLLHGTAPLSSIMK